jgi:hypothetical protein
MSAGQGYHLYVIELKPDAPRRCPLCSRVGEDAAIAVYVGQSWCPPSVPFEMHRQGSRSSSVVQQFGARLRLDLVDEPAWTRTKRHALRRERELAEELCQRGYIVFGVIDRVWLIPDFRSCIWPPMRVS